jgi:hypothetical protein
MVVIVATEQTNFMTGLSGGRHPFIVSFAYRRILTGIGKNTHFSCAHHEEVNNRERTTESYSNNKDLSQKTHHFLSLHFCE